MLHTEAKVEQQEIVEMVWVGSLESLHSVLRKPRFVDAPLQIHTGVPTKLDLISPLDFPGLGSTARGLFLDRRFVLA